MILHIRRSDLLSYTLEKKKKKRFAIVHGIYTAHQQEKIKELGTPFDSILDTRKKQRERIQALPRAHSESVYLKLRAP